MAAVDSLVGLIDLRKADALVLEAGRVPTLLGGRGGESLTMPPLEPAMMALFLEELYTPQENAAVLAGKIVERVYNANNNGSFVIKARMESGRAKLTIRRGSFVRAAAPDPTPSMVSQAHESTLAPPEPFAASLPPRLALDDRTGVQDPLPDGAARKPTGMPRGTPMLRQLLAEASTLKASDVLLSGGRPPTMKVLGHVTPMDAPAMSEEQLLVLLDEWLTPVRHAQLASAGSVDFALQLGEGGQRFRVNVFRQLNGLAAVLRPIAQTVPDLAGLSLPPTLLRLIAIPHGLVLMTGPTGSGKSTTLAALLEYVNRTRACHIVTLEDPIEYQFPQRQALFHQREVGSHMSTFAVGLRAALRESPDILLVGEMRDPETIALALTAAETGHLVLSTLHAGSAAGAIDRMVNAFGESQRPSVRAQIAACLRFVVTQHLVPSADGQRIPVVEQLAVNHAVSAQIRDGRTQLLTTQMELGNEEGMVTLEASLLDLVRKGRISPKAALAVAPNRETFESLLTSGAGPRNRPRGPA